MYLERFYLAQIYSFTNTFVCAYSFLNYPIGFYSITFFMIPSLERFIEFRLLVILIKLARIELESLSPVMSLPCQIFKALCGLFLII